MWRRYKVLIGSLFSYFFYKINQNIYIVVIIYYYTTSTKGELSTIHYSDKVDFYELWEFLNKLNDENEQLKKWNEYLKKRCNEYWEEAGLNNDYYD